MSKISEEQYAALREYFTRVFTAPVTSGRLSQHGSSYAGNEPGLLRYHFAKNDFHSAKTDEAFRAWCDARLSNILWERFLTWHRQTKFVSNNKRVSTKLSAKTHQKLVEFAEENGFSINDAVETLLQLTKPAKRTRGNKS